MHLDGMIPLERGDIAQKYWRGDIAQKYWLHL
jgi:hypothetical protein